MWIYVYPNNTETEITNLYVGIPFPSRITLDKSYISLTTVGQTEQLTATLTPTICDQSVTWSSDDTTIATVSTTGLVTCVTPWECTITATTVNGLTATCSVVPSTEYKYLRWTITMNRGNIAVTQMSEFGLYDSNWNKLSRPSGTSITGNIIWPWSETVDKIIDGSVYTKYCPNWALPVIITITLGTDVDFSVYNTYKWYTANDFSERDPVSWTIELSNDQSNWTTVATVSNATITTSRYSLAFTWTITL